MDGFGNELLARSRLAMMKNSNDVCAAFEIWSLRPDRAELMPMNPGSHGWRAPLALNSSLRGTGWRISSDMGVFGHGFQAFFANSSFFQEAIGGSCKTGEFRKFRRRRYRRPVAAFDTEAMASRSLPSGRTAVRYVTRMKAPARSPCRFPRHRALKSRARLPRRTACFDR